MATVHIVPRITDTHASEATSNGIPDICRAVDALRHQLEMYRRQVSDHMVERKLLSLARRIAKLRTALNALQ